MSTTVAFLRGINVAGHKKTAMADLVHIFEGLGLRGVRTYIQSGNVIFDTRAKDLKRLRTKIESTLLKELGYEVTVILRTHADLARVVDRDPFKSRSIGTKVKPFVTFLAERPATVPKLPMWSTKFDVEVFEIDGSEAFSLSYEKKGRFGFPNALIEKQLGVAATTRNWTTVCKVAALSTSSAA